MTHRFREIVRLSQALRRYDQAKTAAHEARATAEKNGIAVIWCSEDGERNEAQDALIATVRSIVQAQP